MANQDIPKGYQLYKGIDEPLKFLAANGDTIKAGDLVFLDSSGYANDTASVVPLGVAVSNIIDGYTGAINATAATASYDYVMVLTNPFNLYIGQIASGALTNPYTTRSSAACFDNAGSSGAHYINQAAHTQDTWKVIGAAFEFDKGTPSAAGAYQKVFCQINPHRHWRGDVA